MHPTKNVTTLLRLRDSLASGVGSSTLPPDLLKQVRGRVQLLSALLFVAFALDPVLFFGRWGILALQGREMSAEFRSSEPFQWMSVAASLASAGLWWAARSGRVAPNRLQLIGLSYQVCVCFTIALTSQWQFFLDHGILPNLTHVVTVVVLFPLVMPGAPRRMLVASILSAAMSPFTLFLLQVTRKVPVNSEDYAQAIVSPAFAVLFAFVGARVIYGLGRELVAARELGSYRLVEKLGEGGMGEVWKARHQMLARPAAIKMIRPRLQADPRASAEQMRRRFEREAQAIAGLRSPHTVHLYDFGVADNGAFYCVMELLDGVDADTLVRRFGPLPWERVVHLWLQVCHSLSEADSRGLVHRDVKPANLFVCRYGEDHDFVKVLDFGLVKAMGDTAEPGVALTQETAVHGTPAFMAPEQALGNPHIDGRADLYATGCVAYWLLTGEAVFEAASAMALLFEHIHTKAPAPSTRSELPIPEALDQLILACLQKRPEDRPANFHELAMRLQKIDNEHPWTAERAQMWWATHLPQVQDSSTPVLRSD